MSNVDIMPAGLPIRGSGHLARGERCFPRGESFHRGDVVEHRGAESFQRGDVVEHQDAESFQRVDVVEHRDAESFQRGDVVEHRDAESFQRGDVGVHGRAYANIWPAKVIGAREKAFTAARQPRHGTHKPLLARRNSIGSLRQHEVAFPVKRHKDRRIQLRKRLGDG